MTFTNGSGFEDISPIEADLMLGDLWKIRNWTFRESVGMIFLCKCICPVLPDLYL